MFSEAIDPAYAIVLHLFSGQQNSEKDYADYLLRNEDAIERFASHEAPVYVLVVDPENEPPSAAWRKKFALISKRVPAHVLFVFVGGSRLTRGVMTAISWLAPRSYETKICASRNEGRDAILARRALSASHLDDLLSEARASPSR